MLTQKNSKCDYARTAKSDKLVTPIIRLITWMANILCSPQLCYDIMSEGVVTTVANDQNKRSDRARKVYVNEAFLS